MWQSDDDGGDQWTALQPGWEAPVPFRSPVILLQNCMMLGKTFPVAEALARSQALMLGPTSLVACPTISLHALGGGAG